MSARRVRAAALIAALSVGASLARPTAAADPRIDYILHCRGCHGADGGGAVGAVPSFRGHVGKFLRVDGGREYLIRVPGTSQSELSDARVAAVLNWIVREFSPADVSPDFTPFTESEVARLRRPPLSEVDSVRKRLVRAIEDDGGPGTQGRED